MPGARGHRCGSSERRSSDSSPQCPRPLSLDPLRPLYALDPLRPLYPLHALNPLYPRYPLRPLYPLDPRYPLCEHASGRRGILSTFTIRTLMSNELDFVSLGALVHRLDPGIIPFRKAMECLIHVSGGEFNTAANLADCFRMRTGVATAMVDYPIGDLIAERVRAMGVTPFYKTFAHNGVNGPNMATVYSDRGFGVRGPVVFYNRANEAAAQLKPGDFDWPAIFAKGVRWFHSGGIFAALSKTTGELIIEAMQAARAAGATVSFDLNYREKLWNL